MSSNLISRDIIVQFSNEIQDYDTKIEEGAGSKTAGIRSVKNKAASDSQVDVSSLLGFFSQITDDATRAGVWFKFENEFKKTYLPNIDAFIESQVSAAPEGAKLEEEALKNLMVERKSVVEKYNAMCILYKLLNGDDDLSDLPKVKKMSGGRGPRGPRAITSYQFSVDGVKLSHEDNGLSYIAKLQEGWKTKDLREFVIANVSLPDGKFDFKSPPETFSFTLPNGKSVSASKLVEVEDDDDEDDDTDEPF